MIDIAALNTLVLCLFKNPRWHEMKHGQRRRLFLHELGMALVLPQIELRHAMTGLRSDTRLATVAILSRTVASPLTSSTGATVSVAECAMCVRESYDTDYNKAKDNANKVKQRCVKCGQHTCKKHRSASVVCKSCNNQRKWKLTLTIISRHN